MTSQSQLLVRKGFLALFITQLLSAFNDNFIKNAVVIWISARQAHLFGMAPDVMISLCSAIFTLPYFALSALAGQLADRYEKPRLIRYIKLAEIAIAALGGLGLVCSDLRLMLLSILLLGVHSTFLGPIKYSILPQLVQVDELVGGNALIEMGTFLAILVGTIGGGVVVLMQRGESLITVGACLWAVLGYVASLRLPRLPPVAPELRVDYRLLRPTLEILRITRKTRAVFLSVLGISWFWFFGAVFLSLLPKYAHSLGASEHVVTFFLALFCVGIALGSLLTEKVSGKNLELGLVPLGSIGITLFTFDLYVLGCPAAVSSVPLPLDAFLRTPMAYRIALDMFGLSIFSGFYTVPLYTLIQQRAEPSARSRVIAGNNILNALFMVIGSALLALLFALEFSVPAIFLTLALLNAAVAVYIYNLLPEFLLRFFTWILSNTLYRLRVTGHEHIPEQGGAVIVCNHVSFVDFMVVAGAIRRPVRFVMDHRIASTPVVSLLFKQGKTIPIASARQDGGTMTRAFERIAAELRSGELVCIFPEGRLTRDGELGEFRSGVERIIEQTPVPVVPVALTGLWGSMFSKKSGKKGLRLPRAFRSRLQLTIGAPVPPEQVTAVGLQQRVHALLAEAQGAVVQPEVAAPHTAVAP